MIYQNKPVFIPIFCNKRQNFQRTKVKLNCAFFSMLMKSILGESESPESQKSLEEKASRKENFRQENSETFSQLK
jgi:hypothetical protein